MLASIEYPKITYEDIYKSMFGNWEEMKYQNSYRGDMLEGAIAVEESFLTDGTDGAIPEAPASDTSTNIVFKEAEAVAAEKNEVEYGTTNVQTEGVEEADVVKNDGRYLYQIGGLELMQRVYYGMEECGYKGGTGILSCAWVGIGTWQY